MKKENELFLENYKQLDNYIKDERKTETGISDYINDLEKLNKKEKYNSYIKLLKDLRYKRNKLAHEVSMDEKFITKEDLEYLNALIKLFNNKKDPLAKRKRKVSKGININELKLKLFPIIFVLLIISIIMNIILILN